MRDAPLSAAAMTIVVGGSVEAAVLHVAEGQTQSIAGTHVYDSVLIEGRLNLTGSTTIVSHSSFTIQNNGFVVGTGAHGSHGSNGTLLNPPTDGGNGSHGRTLVINAAGELKLLEGYIQLGGWNGGSGGDGHPLSTQDGRDGGDGGNGGNLHLQGDSVVFGESFDIFVHGGHGGHAGFYGNPPGPGGGAPGFGGDGGDGGDVIVEYVQALHGAPRTVSIGAGTPGRLVEEDHLGFVNGGQAGEPGAYTVVPEPMMGLVAAAGMGLLLAGRRRSSRASA